jgi:hypothetical protein
VGFAFLRFAAAGLLVVLLWSAAAEAYAPRPVTVEVDANELLGQLLARHPLPEGYARASRSAGRPVATLRLATSHGALLPTVVPARSAAAASAAVSWQPFVPVVAFTDARESVTAAAAAGLQQIPLSEVRLPQRAVAVDGLYPGDPGYPLWAAQVATIESDDEVLLAWLAAAAVAQPAVDVVWLAAVGDIMPGRGVDQLLLQEGVDAVLPGLGPVLRAADITIGNLEAVATARGAPIEKRFNFRFTPAALAPLRAAGFDYLSAANNHALDYGRAGLRDTLAALTRAGIATSGAGVDVAAARRVASFIRSEETIRILSAGGFPSERTGFGAAAARVGADSPGMLWADRGLFDAVAEQMTEVGLDIVYLHFGSEWMSTPGPQQQHLARKLIDAGVEVVIGAHPHFLQGMEVYGGGLIVYSLGNFLFPGMQGTGFGEESLVLRLGIHGAEVRYLEMVGARLEGRRTRLDRHDAITGRVRELSAQLASDQAHAANVASAGG